MAAVDVEWAAARGQGVRGWLVPLVVAVVVAVIVIGIVAGVAMARAAGAQ